MGGSIRLRWSRWS